MTVWRGGRLIASGVRIAVSSSQRLVGDPNDFVLRCSARSARSAGAPTGLHTGECGLAGPRVQGPAVHIAGQVMACAAPGEVVVSNTVRDLPVFRRPYWLPTAADQPFVALLAWAGCRDVRAVELSPVHVVIHGTKRVRSVVEVETLRTAACSYLIPHQISRCTCMGAAHDFGHAARQSPPDRVGPARRP